jgi:hypothetical protein
VKACLGVRTDARTSHLALALAALGFFVSVGPGLGAQAPVTRPDRPSETSQGSATQQADAIKEFQARLNGYVDLRAQLAKKLQPQSPTASASELATRQEALANAIKSARKAARKGDLIPTSVGAQLVTIVQNDFRQRPVEARKAAFEEVPTNAVPVINRTYPAQAALPTVPPLLLAKLPTLPDNLQYRFLARHLVILDGDTQIIIDYVANALPPR